MPKGSVERMTDYQDKERKKGKGLPKSMQGDLLAKPTVMNGVRLYGVLMLPKGFAPVLPSVRPN